MSQAKEIPELVTERLRLRPLKSSDAKVVQSEAGNPKIEATTAAIPHPCPDGAAEEWISRHSEWFAKGIRVNWAIDLLSEKRVVGMQKEGLLKQDFCKEGVFVDMVYSGIFRAG